MFHGDTHIGHPFTADETYSTLRNACTDRFLRKKLNILRKKPTAECETQSSVDRQTDTHAATAHTIRRCSYAPHMRHATIKFHASKPVPSFTQSNDCRVLLRMRVGTGHLLLRLISNCNHSIHPSVERRNIASLCRNLISRRLP